MSHRKQTRNWLLSHSFSVSSLIFMKQKLEKVNGYDATPITGTIALSPKQSTSVCRTKCY
jgi:hypothetical protein